MLVRVETVKTPCTKDELIRGFIEGWQKLSNTTPSKKSIAVLYAQNALETGGTVSMYNYNLGNIKVKDNPNETIEYCALVGVWEIVNGKKVTLSKEDPGSWFRSFRTLADGVKFYFAFLKNNRYKTAWTAVEAGNPSNFAHLLKVAGYYTASEADYAKIMVYYFNKFMADTVYEKALAAIEADKKAAEAAALAAATPSPVITIPEVEIVGKVSLWQSIVNFIKNLLAKR